MRYFNQPTIVFENAEGGSFEIKETRTLESLNTAFELGVNNGDAMDEVATRGNVFGDDSEMLVYKIFDHNAISITENNFIFGTLKSIKVPAV